MDVSSISGFHHTLAAEYDNQGLTSVQGQVFEFSACGELFGRWQVTQHALQQVFAEKDGTTGTTTVRAIVCDGQIGDDAYEKCRNGPVRAACEAIVAVGRRPTAGELAVHVRQPLFPPQQAQLELEKAIRILRA